MLGLWGLSGENGRVEEEGECDDGTLASGGSKGRSACKVKFCGCGWVVWCI